MNDVFYKHPDDEGVMEHEAADLTGEPLPSDGWDSDIALEEIADKSKPPT